MIPIEQITKIIAERCSREAAIDAAYLFGSATLDRRKLSSDIDVAILIDNASPIGQLPYEAFISMKKSFGSSFVSLMILDYIGKIRLKFEHHSNLFPFLTTFLDNIPIRRS